jgi:hypothetical protein
VIAHCKKTHDNPAVYPDTRAMMIRQSKTIDAQIIAMIGDDKLISRVARRKRDRFGLKEWLVKVRES